MKYMPNINKSHIHISSLLHDLNPIITTDNFFIAKFSKYSGQVQF